MRIPRLKFFRPISPGFTIIELVVAIFVVFLLIAIIITTLSRAAERAAMAQSSSNIRQCTSGLLLLMSDRRGVLSVRGGGYGSGSWETSFWPHQLEYFLSINRPAFFSNLAEHGLENGIFQNDLLWTYRVSYGLNFTHEAWQSSRNEGEYLVETIYFSRIEDPSNTILLASSMEPRGYGRYAINHLGRGSGGALHLRYSGKALVGFVDGSVRALSGDDLKKNGFTGAYGQSVDDWITF